MSLNSFFLKFLQSSTIDEISLLTKSLLTFFISLLKSHIPSNLFGIAVLIPSGEKSVMPIFFKSSLYNFLLRFLVLLKLFPIVNL